MAAWRATAALAAELVLGGVLAVGLATVAASPPDHSAAIALAVPPPAHQSLATAVPPTLATTTSAPITTTTATPATTTATPATTTATPKTTTTTTTSPVSTVAPIATHRATLDVLTPREVAAPMRLSIPSLGIDGSILPTGVNSENELDVPPDALSLVWYRHGPVPGEPGSAVIAGHLNWRGVTGLFADLAGIPIGAPVTVAYGDGTQRSFTVTTVELVPKPAVSVNGVFARAGAPVLRLVTCGGEFDDDVNSYRSNVVVTAVPA